MGNMPLEEKWNRAIKEFYPSTDHFEEKENYDEIKELHKFTEPKIDALRKQKE